MKKTAGTPLGKKLGLKEGQVVKLIAQPEHYFGLFTDFPEVRISKNTKPGKDFIHFFATKLGEIEKKIPALKSELKQDGMIWVSWPKKSSKIPTDIDENAIRRIALENGLVDIKVCAIDETWSRLKLVIPVKDRK